MAARPPALSTPGLSPSHFLLHVADHLHPWDPSRTESRERFYLFRPLSSSHSTLPSHLRAQFTLWTFVKHPCVPGLLKAPYGAQTNSVDSDASAQLTPWGAVTPEGLGLGFPWGKRLPLGQVLSGTPMCKETGNKLANFEI